MTLHLPPSPPPIFSYPSIHPPIYSYSFPSPLLRLLPPPHPSSSTTTTSSYSSPSSSSPFFSLISSSSSTLLHLPPPLLLLSSLHLPPSLFFYTSSPLSSYSFSSSYFTYIYNLCLQRLINSMSQYHSQELTCILNLKLVSVHLGSATRWRQRELRYCIMVY